MTLTDKFTRLCGTGQLLDGVTSAGVLSTDWIDLDTGALGNKRALGGGRMVVARFGCSVSLNSATENATIDLQIVTLPKTTISTFTTNGDTDISVANDTIIEASHGLTNGTRVTVASSGAFPAGLAASTNYYLRDVADNFFKVSLSPGGPVVDITGTAGGVTLTWTWHPEILVAVPGIGIDRIMANLTGIEVALPPPQTTRLYPVGRYLFARFVPSATLATPGGTMTCDIVGGYAQDGSPFNKINYVTP
jgi:hypothetical protein